MKNFLSVKEAADTLEVATPTIYRYVREGVLPGFRLGNGARAKVFIPRDAFFNALAAKGIGVKKGVGNA